MTILYVFMLFYYDFFKKIDKQDLYRIRVYVLP